MSTRNGSNESTTLDPMSETVWQSATDRTVTWIAHPEETMQRASHAAAFGDEVLLIDPLAVDDLDSVIAPVGEPTGIVVLFDRHTRDADRLAREYDIPIYLPEALTASRAGLKGETRPVESVLPDHITPITLVANRFWLEVMLCDAEHERLFVPETLGTTRNFRAGDEPVGVHPMMRFRPPRSMLEDRDVDQLFVGHGQPLDPVEQSDIETVLRRSRVRIPKAIVGGVKAALR